MNFRLLSTENHRLFYPDTRATTPHGATQWHVLHHGIGVTAGERQHNSVGLISTTVATKKSGSTNLQNVRHCSIISHYKWASSSPASLLCLFFRDMGGGWYSWGQPHSSDVAGLICNYSNQPSGKRHNVSFLFHIST
jgi:hypothetical protein